MPTRTSATSTDTHVFADEFEVLATPVSKLVIDLKVRATGSCFRVSPERDPRQPRLWCVSVRQCGPGSGPVTDGPVWIDRPGLAWADLVALMQTLCTDLADWLAWPNRAELYRWLLTAAPVPSAAQQLATARSDAVTRGTH
jgi:hypothetical protein